MSISNFPTFSPQPATTPVSQFALRIVVEGDGMQPTPIGTGVWICAHLVLTAKHNLDAILKMGNISNQLNPRGKTDIDLAVRLYQILPGPNYAIWQVVTAWSSGESDLAILHVGLYGYTSDSPPVAALGLAIRALAPEIGSKVAGFGYHSSVANMKSKPDGGYHLDLNDIAQATTGSIIDIFPQGRDRVMYPFPCFQINARFNSGMSGGPVFDEQGCLIGIISGSLQASGEGEEEISYAATLWPALRILIQAQIPGKTTPIQPYPAIDLAIAGILHVKDIKQLNSSWFPGRPATHFRNENS